MFRFLYQFIREIDLFGVDFLFILEKGFVYLGKSKTMSEKHVGEITLIGLSHGRYVIELDSRWIECSKSDAERWKDLLFEKVEIELSLAGRIIDIKKL